MVWDQSNIREGMSVLSSDGEKLGKIASCSALSFTIEKGFFFRKDYVAGYDEIFDVSGDEVRLAMAKDDFLRLREPAGAGWTGSTSRTGGEDVRVPIAEEELDVTKRDREAGEVRLRKDVVTERKHVDVPVTREEVHVERVPVSEHRDLSPGEKAFEKEQVSMPIREEEVEVRKRPVVKEEVRLRRDRTTERRAAEADVRKEEVDIEREGDARGIREEDESLHRR